MSDKKKPEGKKLKEAVLAEGEVTGHAHRLADSEVEVWEQEDGSREFTLTEDTELTHEEHGTLKVPAGDRVADQIVEYDPFLEETRRVAD